MSVEQDVSAIRRLIELSMLIAFMTGVVRLVVAVVAYLYRKGP